MSGHGRGGDGAGADVVVVGSVNVDVSVRVDRFPRPGETVTGADLVTGGGGKGANQAVGLARLGRSVAMVAAVGADAAGRSVIDAMVADGVDVSSLIEVDDVTGTALIEVDGSGENRIVVVPGANGRLDPDAVVERAGAALARAPVVLTQLETPLAVFDRLRTLAGAGRLGGPLVLNPAPAPGPLDLSGVDIVIPNRSELSILSGPDPGPSDGESTGRPTDDGEDHGPPAVDELVDRARSLAGSPAIVVVTLGRHGALVIERADGSGRGRVSIIEPEPVTAVDTTAAGDAFCAGLVDALAAGADAVEGARWGAKVAALTVTRRGAQASLPTLADLTAAGYRR